MNDATTIRFVCLDLYRDLIVITVALMNGKPADSSGPEEGSLPHEASPVAVPDGM